MGEKEEEEKATKRLRRHAVCHTDHTSQRESPALDSSYDVLIFFISGKHASKDGGRTSPVDLSPFFSLSES